MGFKAYPSEMPCLSGLQRAPLETPVDKGAPGGSLLPSFQAPPQGEKLLAAPKPAWIGRFRAGTSETRMDKGLPGALPGDTLFMRASEGWLGTVFQFMFFDALEPLYLGRLRAFYVF